MKNRFFLILAVLLLAVSLSAQVRPVVTVDFVIPVNTAVSAAVPLGQCWIVGFIVPTGWTAANIAIAASTTTSGATVYNTQDRYGSRLTFVATANTWTVVDVPAETWGWRSAKVQSINSSGADVNQTGVAASTRTVKGVCR